jgi:hypothetical protein
MEYDADRRALKIYKKIRKTNKMEPATPNGTATDVVKNKRGELCFAALLSSGSIGIKGNQLSIRSCGVDKWSAFSPARLRAMQSSRKSAYVVGGGMRG